MLYKPETRNSASVTPLTPRVMSGRKLNHLVKKGLPRDRASLALDEIEARARDRVADLRAQRTRRQLLRAWKKFHREELEEALAGVHRDVMGRLMAHLANLRSARELVTFIEAQEWGAVDAQTRLVALHEINSAICELRERSGLPPIDEALPGEPLRAFQLIRNIMHQFPAQSGKANLVGMTGQTVKLETSHE